MTSKYRKLLYVSEKRTQALALLLLAAIAWGATAEVTHHHRQSNPASAEQLASAGDLVASERIESPSKGTSSNRTTTRDECLICQLHQNLFGTLLSHSQHTAPAATGILYSRAAPDSYSSQFNTPQRGRAPPFIL